MIALLRIIRGLVGFILMINVIGIITFLVRGIMFMLNKLFTQAGMSLGLAIIYLLISIVLGLIFFGLRVLINNMYIKKTGQDVPLLQKRLSL